MRSRDSSVDAMSRIQWLITCTGKRSSFLHRRGPCSVALLCGPAFWQVGSFGYSSRGNMAGTRSDRPLPPSDELRNAWMYSSRPLYILVTHYLMKYKDFIFTLPPKGNLFYLCAVSTLESVHIISNCNCISLRHAPYLCHSRTLINVTTVLCLPQQEVTEVWRVS
jgi:hypothetical protein